MPQKAMTAGLILVLIGLGGYAASSFESLTAMIPAAIGIVLLALGAASNRESLRKHMMHIAAVVALIGLIPSAIRITGTLASGTVANPLATISQALTAAVCLWFLVEAVRSFIVARRARP